MRNYISKKYTFGALATRLLLLSLDTIALFLSLVLAFLLRHNFDFSETFPISIKLLGILLIVRLVTFKIFTTYSLIIRYIGEEDLKKVFYATFIGSTIMLLVSVLDRFEIVSLGLPISVVIIDFILLLFLLVSYRVLMRLMHSYWRQNNLSKTNVIIYGAGKMGSTLIKTLNENKHHTYNIVAIFDDNRDIHRKRLNGYPVYNLVEGILEKTIEKYNVKKAFVAIKELPLERKTSFINTCLESSISVLKIPPTEQWIEGDLSVPQFKEIQLEDLLGRTTINLDNDAIEASINGKVILITGAAGSIGSEICRILTKYNAAQLVLVDQAESALVDLGLSLKEHLGYTSTISKVADVNNIKRLRSIFREYKPNYVFHAAAYKHVPINENDPYEVVNVNVIGTKNVADLAVEFDVEKFVMVSTDKAVNPTNVMGATKRMAELYVQSKNSKQSGTRFVITRFGNVLGSNGSVVPRFKEQIAKGGPVTVTDRRITRYFMTIPEACQLVIEAGVMGNGGEIFVFDMGTPIRIVDMAEQLIRLSGFEPYEEIDIEFVGLRPGEKLYEELLHGEENTIPTHHKKIKKAITGNIDFNKIRKAIQDLESTLDEKSSFEIVQVMKYFIPEYQSNNSKFEILDDIDKSKEIEV